MSEFRHQNNGMPITFEQTMYIYKTYGILLNNPMPFNNTKIKRSQDILTKIEKKMNNSFRYKLLTIWYKIQR